MQSWFGHFNSKMYPRGHASGMAEVMVDPVAQSRYTSPLTVVYNGLYRNGNTVKVNATIDGNTIECTFPSGQRLTFSVQNRSEECIKGEYNSQCPSDYGTFVLTPGVLLAQDMPNYTSIGAPSCQIL
jgi:hypothetical protein